MSCCRELALEGNEVRHADLVDLEIKRLMAETQNQIPKVPADLDLNYKVLWRLAGLTAGATLGGKFGAGFGIAGGFLGAITGTVPGAIIGGIIGFLGGSAIGEKVSAEE